MRSKERYLTSGTSSMFGPGPPAAALPATCKACTYCDGFSNVLIRSLDDMDVPYSPRITPFKCHHLSSSIRVTLPLLSRYSYCSGLC